ncbi:unnamed protein product [Symbiodinium natans]|uniref:Uncharacterized protein n=1 Tax=Symbiodinium natans TaxID=878477 RepID=A0A812L4R9_9DINO|nr:unnamed protein product [Symbiodinium natans]
MLSRPNGELTRADQYYYQLIGRPPPSRQYDRNQPLIREGPNDYIMLRGGAKKLLRSLQPNGNYHLTKLGKSFFKDKWVDWVVHVPVIIRGIRRNGRNRGMPYERTKRLPVTDLNASALAQLGNPEPNDIIWELSDETYYLDATKEWTFSQQAMQVVDDRVVVETVLDQPLGALRDVSYQLYCGDEIEQRPDKLCVPRQLAELMRLPLQEVLSDFDAICTKKTWREQGVTPREIREFCLWRQAPMFYVDCQGRLLDKYEPTVKEQRAVAFTSWNGHAFFYKSARTVAKCEPIGERARYRGERKPGETPEFKDWREWEGEVASGHFYTEDLEQVRRELLAEGHCPKVVMRSMSEWRCLRLRVRGGEDCVISAFHEDLDVLQAWMGRLGLPYCGQRLAGAASEVFLHLLKARRDPPGSRQALLAEQDHQCKLCAAPITATTCELDHIVPVHQSFAAQAQNLQALCLECHRNKTALESSHATTLESRFSRRAYEQYVESPRLPPLVFKLNSHKPDHICHGIDVVRCRKNGLAHAKFPAPIFCPKDNVEQAREGHLADLTYVRLREDGRWAAFKQLPYVGQGWYAKPAVAYMLEKGLATWSDFVHSLDATAHVDQESVAQALQKMEAAWPEGEEHYAKLSVNALIGLWARNMNLIYTMRTSNHQFDGSGCQHRELFLDAAGGMHWDHIYVTQLLSNRSCRPVHDFVMASEYVAVSRIRDALATVPSRYLKAVKTDCVVFQDLPKKFQGLVDSLVRERHPDGTPVYRCEEVKGLEGQYRIPRIEAEWMCNIDAWKVAEDPVLHCLEGGSLLLTGYPGTGKTHLARQIVTALREEGYKVKIITKTHSSVQNFGMQAETADHWVRSTVRNGYCNIDWLVVEEITQLDTGLWNDVTCVSMNRKVKFLLLGDFRQFPAVMDNFAGTPVQRELKHCQLLHDLTDGWHHELTENRRSDPGIFDFLRWLRVDEPREQSLPEAVRAAQERFPRQGEPDVSLVISHAHRIRINARDNRRLAPPEAVTIEYTGTGPTTTNMPQTMRVWPGLKLIGVGGRVTKGIYVHVAEVGPEKIVLDGGDSFTHAALLKHTRLCHAITYASCQGLTLEGRVFLCRGFGLSELQVRHFHQKPALARHEPHLAQICAHLAFPTGQVARILQRLLVGVPEADSGQIDLELDEAVPAGGGLEVGHEATLHVRRGEVAAEDFRVVEASLGQLALDVLLDRLQVCLGGLVLLETQGESPGFRLAAVGAGVPQDAQPLAGPPGLRAHREELAATLVGRKLTELEYRFGLHRSFFFSRQEKKCRPPSPPRSAGWPCWRACWSCGPFLFLQQMRLLELFSGTGSVGRAFGWEVTSLDNNPKASPTICSDILQWDYKAFEPGHFDAVWASPCCTEFSIALKKRPRNLPLGDALVLKTLEGLHWDKVTYCKYGFRYKKPTAIWHNLPWTPSQGPCRKGDRCEAFQGTRHPEAAQRGPTKGRQGSNSRDQLYSIPPVRLFKTPEYSVKQPPDPVVCKPPANGILCAPSASGKTVLLVSMILEQYRGCFERIYIFSPSVEVDPAWQPVKDYIRDELGVNTDREQCWWEDWDEGALRKIISDQKRITQKSKELGLKKLYSVLVVLDDHADNPAAHRKTGDGVLDTLFIRGRHFCINTWVSTQKLRLMSSAVRVNVMFYCVFRLRNQLELDALVEELSAMLPKETLYAMYEEATREPYSFWFVNLRAPKEDMFWVRFDRKFLLNGDAPEPDGIYDPSHWPPPERPRQTSDGSNASEFSARPTRFFRRRSKKGMTSIYVDSRLRAEGTDSSFSFDIGESVHIQSGAKLAVYKVRVADAFLSTDRGTFLYWEDTVAGTLHYAELPVGAYTGPRLAAWISSNFASASYTAETNELDVTWDGVRLILNDAELRQRFPGTAPYPPGASPSKPLSINHLLGPSYLTGSVQRFVFVTMNPFSELYLRCPTLANGETTVGPLGHDILCKIVVSKGVGHVMETETSEGHWVQLHGPITLRHLRFKLTDYQGNIVNTRGTSISFVVFLDTER